ncbi:helix-turn-helix domain-containing protein [Propionimicrobium lymphophilum]|uniref:helix-turn-helix domain-containing protein n=1 Tax=Propionimicrobium lymphophilum TaxID=33012 RepID=UPI0034DF16AA
MTAELTDSRTLSTAEIAAGEIRALMGRFKLKQADLGTVLGLTRTQAGRKLNMVTPFTLDELDVLAEWFSTTPQVLMGFALEPRPKNPAYKEFLVADATRNSDSYTAWDSNPEPID